MSEHPNSPDTCGEAHDVFNGGRRRIRKERPANVQTSQGAVSASAIEVKVAHNISHRVREKIAAFFPWRDLAP